MPEKIPPPESRRESPEETLARLLKEKGVDDPETKALLLEWTQTQEQAAEQSPNPDAQINFELKRARLYFAAGYTEEAQQTFEAAYIMAWNERNDDLAKKINEEMTDLGLR